jgi:class 3 adenylate cyclase/tetratricopeptide (TPR) repeat protein
MATPRRERKVVTVLFCDLVGFTSQAESMDPEDVEALLRPYHTRVREELERHGGTVEKFIGDAVMALFGAPVAHEDDPERAVRSALAIRDFAVEGGLELRVGITTGEAVISLDARPAEGEGMASGDVVNTAARLQSAAPVNSVLVDETTQRASRGSVEYEEGPPIEAKGKSRPVEVWMALAAKSRFGVDIAHEARTELVGREREVAILRDAFARARHERVPQLVTLVGVPGIGKSRLVYELSQLAEADPDLITWRQGRCLAYGDGVTLWALGEIVKAQAGIVEQDSPPEVHAKVREAVASAVSDSDASWVESHLLALVGLAEESELGGDRRGEAFAAWRRYLEALAEQRPVVLVFEDLHWADESLLDFVDELVDWVTDVPLLVVATARPELLERRAGWGGGKLNATTLALQPLSDEQTAFLIGQLLQRPVLVAESQQALLERAGGNPLYAEQFADLYLERGSAEDLPLPETLQGIIAARVDALPEPEKGLLREAAVVGKVFWVSALGRDRQEAGTTLHALERKGFVRRQRRSSVEGENELAFAHALVRDVSYGQIPRAERSEKHSRIAEWIESLGRPEDHAEMLAHHWQSALELSSAAGMDDPTLRERTRDALTEAGDRAFALNAFVPAAKYFSAALELWPEEASGRPQLIFRRARALQISDDDRAGDALEEATAALLAAGEVDAAGEAESLRAQFFWYRGQRDAADAHLATAQDLIEGRPASPAKARILCVAARFRMLAGDGEQALRVGQEALALAEDLALDELRAHALATIGGAKEIVLGTGGMEELERALEIALAASSPIASTIVNNLAVAKFRGGKLIEAAELYREAYRLAERFGDGSGLRWSRGNLLFAMYFFGEWDEAEREADAFIAECEKSPHYLETNALAIRGQIRLARGDVDAALEDWRRGLELARDAKDPQTVVPSLLTYAYGLTLLGRRDEARRLADEALAVIARQPRMGGVLGIVVGVGQQLGIHERMLEILEAESGERSPWREATLTSMQGDFRRAAELYEAMGARTQAADARLHAARELIEAGQRNEGEVELQKALAFYRSVGATFFVRRGEELLAASA